MRALAASLVAVLTLPVSSEANDLPQLMTALPDVAVTKNSAIPMVNLRNYFELTGITGPVVQMRFQYGLSPTNGTVNIELQPAAAPVTVANFLNYVDSGSYSNSVIHRSVQAGQGFAVIQGGSFVAPSMSAIATAPPIALEGSLQNFRGTIAMARMSDPNSATSGWFFNVTDNTAAWASGSDGGYAVFGRVTGTGITVIDAIHAVPTYDFGSPFFEIPLADYSPPGAFLNSNLVRVLTAAVAQVFPSTLSVVVTSSSSSSSAVAVAGIPSGFDVGSKFLGATVTGRVGNFIFLSQSANRAITTPTAVPATIAGEQSVITFSFENSNPALVAPVITGSALELFLQPNRAGFSTLNVKAIDNNGNTAQSQFLLAVTGDNPNDRDEDGLPDSWELAHWSSLAVQNAADDFDGDGLSAMEELAFGRDPMVPDAALVPSPIVDGGYLTITVAKQAGVSYEVQCAGTLLSGEPDSFSTAGTVVLIDDSTTLKVRDAIAVGSAPSRFMRVRLSSAP